MSANFEFFPQVFLTDRFHFYSSFVFSSTPNGWFSRMFNIVELYIFIHHECSKYCMYNRSRKNSSVHILQYTTVSFYSILQYHSFLDPKIKSKFKNLKTFKFIQLRILTCIFVFKYYDISYVYNRCHTLGAKINPSN